MIIKNNLDELMDRNPFKVPDGYFEGFTERMMNQLPEKPVERPTVISLYDRVKPWLYMAAAFAGLVLLFHFIDTSAISSSGKQNQESAAVVLPYTPSEEEENDEFMEYIEEEYADKLIASYVFDMME